MRALVEQSDYVTLLPMQLLADHSVRRGVTQVTMQTPMPAWNVAVIYRAHHELSGVCLALFEELRSAARESVAVGSTRKWPWLVGALIIVNEFGAVGIDHEFIERSDDAVVLLENRCLSCSVKGELVAALTRLYERRSAGAIAAYDRVLVETSGLAEVAPLADMLHAQPSVTARYALAGSSPPSTRSTR